MLALSISALLIGLSRAKQWEDILRADITCCNPVDNADICAETTGGAGCVWLEYGISDDIDKIITQSGSQCVGAEYYTCRMETGGCCAPGCDEDTDDPASAPAVAPTDEPNEQICGRGEPLPNCVLGLNYAFEGVPCQISGDPHTKMFNGGHHDFQGQPDAYTADGTSLKNQFYYIAPCSDMSAVDLPVTILGTHMRYRTALVSGLDYLTLELYDRIYKPSATYNLYLSSSFASYAARSDDGVTTDYDETKANAPMRTIENGTTTAIGDRFSAVLLVDGDSTTLELTVDGENTISIFMKAQMSEQTVASGEVRFTMHYVLIQQAEAYKCASCGLCGNFKDKIDFTAETQELERCDGSMVEFNAGDDESVPEAYDPDGWTWERNFVQNECASAGTSTIQYDIADNNGDDFVFVASCDEKIQAMVDTKCEGSRNKLTSCCNILGDDLCDSLEDDCKSDVCVMATIDGKGDRDLIEPSIDSTLVAAIEAACALPGIEEAMDGANIVSYEHVGCWADDEDVRAIEVMRQGLSDIEECLDYCVDDYAFFGVINVRNSNLMCFCTNSEDEYQTYGESDICNNGAGGQTITVIKDEETRTRERIIEVAMDVYKITVESLTGGSDSEVAIEGDIDVAMLGELQRDIERLEPEWQALEEQMYKHPEHIRGENWEGAEELVEIVEKHPDHIRGQDWEGEEAEKAENLQVLFDEPNTVDEHPEHIRGEGRVAEEELFKEGVEIEEHPDHIRGQDRVAEDEELLDEGADAHPDHIRGQDWEAEEEEIEAPQQSLRVVRANDTRWSNKPKAESVWMLTGLLLVVIMICVAGAFRQWSSRKQYAGISEKVSATTYGTNNV